jgi:hypothetical protein
MRRPLVVVAAARIVAFATDAYAAGTEGQPPEATESSEAWGIRLTGSTGVGVVPYAGGVAGAARVDVDAEYWLSSNIGVGGQLGFEWLSSIDLGEVVPYESGHTGRFFAAPAIAIRGSNPSSYPLFSFAFGYALGASEEDRYCDSTDPFCHGYNWTGGGSGPYASLAAAWLFHPGGVRPARAAFALGPLVRGDWFDIPEGPRTGSGWTLTAGMTIGFGIGSTRAR